MGVNGRGKREKQLAAMRPRGTPVPIPNTTVKTRTAEDTALETARESRRPPDYKKENKKQKRKQVLTSRGREPHVCTLGRITGAYSSAG